MYDLYRLDVRAGTFGTQIWLSTSQRIPKGQVVVHETGTGSVLPRIEPLTIRSSAFQNVPTPGTSFARRSPGTGSTVTPGSGTSGSPATPGINRNFRGLPVMPGSCVRRPGPSPFLHATAICIQGCSALQRAGAGRVPEAQGGDAGELWISTFSFLWWGCQGELTVPMATRSPMEKATRKIAR